MKTVIALSLSLTLLLGAFAYNERQQAKSLTQQIASYARQNSQLLAQIESNSREKLQSEDVLRSLQSELNSRSGQLAALSRQLESLQQQVDPDYQEMESQIRQQLRREMAANDNKASTDPRIAILKNLSDLDPMMMSEVLALNAQYGEFISGLDVSEDRKEVIINALHNLITDQNLARNEIIQSLQTDPQAVNRGDLRRQLREVSELSAQLEALSYDFTDSELNAFSEFQQQRQNSFSSFGLINGGTGAISVSPIDGPVNAPVFFNGGLFQSGDGLSRAIRVSPSAPEN